MFSGSISFPIKRIFSKILKNEILQLFFLFLELEALSLQGWNRSMQRSRKWQIVRIRYSWSFCDCLITKFWSINKKYNLLLFCLLSGRVLLVNCLESYIGRHAIVLIFISFVILVCALNVVHLLTLFEALAFQESCICQWHSSPKEVSVICSFTLYSL